MFCSSAVSISWKKDIYLDNDKIIYKNPDEVEVCHVDELQILGTHNYENVMAAVCMAAVYGVPMETIRKAILAFKGVAHRIEYVAEKNGVVITMILKERIRMPQLRQSRQCAGRQSC